jgi:nucleoid DNA-binding protein
MSTVTKKDLIQSISEKVGANPSVVQDIVQSLFDEMNGQLGHGNRIELRDFGVFSFKRRAERVGHNPRTLEKVHVGEKTVVTFKMGKRMKEMVARRVAAMEAAFAAEQAAKSAAAAAGAPSAARPLATAPVQGAAEVSGGSKPGPSGGPGTPGLPGGLGGGAPGTSSQAGSGQGGASQTGTAGGQASS